MDVMFDVGVALAVGFFIGMYFGASVLSAIGRRRHREGPRQSRATLSTTAVTRPSAVPDNHDLALLHIRCRQDRLSAHQLSYRLPQALRRK